MKINLNDKVTGTLTEYGLRVVAALPEHEREHIRKFDLQGSVLSVELWRFMGIFGRYSYAGAPWVITDNVIVVTQPAVTAVPKPLRARRVAKGARHE